MIDVMKQNHQELEVTDMTDLEEAPATRSRAAPRSGTALRSRATLSTRASMASARGMMAIMEEGSSSPSLRSSHMLEPPPIDIECTKKTRFIDSVSKSMTGQVKRKVATMKSMKLAM